MSLVTVDRPEERTMRALFGPEIEVYSPTRVDLYLHLWKWKGRVRVNDRTVWRRTDWEVRGNWAITGNGYGYLQADIYLTAAPGGGLKVDVTPTARIKFLSGWPFPDWIGRIIAIQLSDAITRDIRAEFGTIDFASSLPAEFKSDIAGVVKTTRSSSTTTR